MKKTYLYSILATLLLAVVAFMFFFPDDMEGNVLQQHDTLQGIANGQEGKAFHEATGETTRWTNSLFSGMPNFQIAPSYPANESLNFIARVIGLGLPSPANLLFVMMLGFFIMGLCYRLKWHTALFAAVAWGFSSYFIIIIGAGHIWKFATLAYIPPTIGGIMLCYRGKYLSGTALAALFGALQLNSNHPQMSYYFGFVIVAFILAWLYTAIRKHYMKQWILSTICIIAAGSLAVVANAPSLYSSLKYAKETVRGKATEIVNPGEEPPAGMSNEAITMWSYGVDETATLLIPNVKGGATIKPVAGQNTLLSVGATDKVEQSYIDPQVRQFVSQFPQYFGDQPMTNGPVYVGAFVLMLAILALFVVDTPMKWALFAVSILAILLSWGHNFSWLTDSFIANFPGYNKFRAVSSILVIVEFCVPLLAAICVKKMTDTPDFMKRYKWTFISVMGLGVLVCLVGWLQPAIFGQPFSRNETEQLTQAGMMYAPEYRPIIDIIGNARLSLVSADSLRSLVFILAGAAVTWLYLAGMLKNKTLFVSLLTVIVLIDMAGIDKRYVNSENFTTPSSNETTFSMTNADREILKDTSYYRVLDAAGFGDARSSYFHHTIGGYHAAKLTRYNDLITHQISKGNQGVLDMLNTKYILNGNSYEENPGAMGNAWFVDSISYLNGAAAEMAGLDTIHPAHYAVADKNFEVMLGNASTRQPGDTIVLTSYAPNRLTYAANTSHDNIAVFSEIYFPWGWEAEIDGQPAEIGRVNYVLRAMRVPAGKHTITYTFDPKTVRTANTAAMTSVIAIYAICLLAVALWVIHLFMQPRAEKK